MRILLSSTDEQVLREQLKFFETVLKDSGLDIICVQPGENIIGDAKIMMIGRVAKKRGDLKSFVRKEQTHIFLTEKPDDISEAAEGRGFKIVFTDPVSDKTSLMVWEYVEPLIVADQKATRAANSKPSAEPASPVIKPELPITTPTPQKIIRTNYEHVDAKPTQVAKNKPTTPETPQSEKLTLLAKFLEASQNKSNGDLTLPIGLDSKLIDVLQNQQNNKAFKDLVTATYAADVSPYIRLVDVQPRNELWASTKAYFKESEQSWVSAKDSFDQLSYNQKATMLEALIQNQPKEVDAVYTFEVLGDISDIKIVDDAASMLNVQPVSPRYGFAQVDEDEAEAYEKCFDVASEHYGAMIKAGYESEAYLTCLKGHLARYIFSIKAHKVYKLQEAQIYPELIKKISEVHPLISESL